MPAALQLPSATLAALRRSVLGHADALAGDILDEVFDTLKDGLRSIANPTQVLREGATQTVTEGDTAVSVQDKVAKLLQSFGQPAQLADTLRLDFKLKIASEVTQGAGRYVAQNDPAKVAEYPAWEFLRVYLREVPRGDSGHEGDDDWPTRWTAAAQASGDTDALRLLKETGRMIALKASPIWDSLGAGAGGYEDTLGNPFPPFAFNSGYDLDQIDRDECEALGLVKPGDAVEPARIDPAQLFAEAA